MYAAETNGDQVKAVVEEGISDEVAQKVMKCFFNILKLKNSGLLDLR